MSTLATIRTRIQQITSNHIDAVTATAIINRCAQEETEGRNWTSQRTNMVINSSAPKGDGVVDVTQGSNIFVGTGTAFDASDVGKQIRVGAGANAVGLFTVAAVLAANQLQLTSVFPGVTAAAQPYFMFQQFYVIPNGDQILNIQGGNQLDLVQQTHEQLNRKDPLRQATANPPNQWAPKGLDPVAQRARFEFWPIPSAALPFVVEFIMSFFPLVNDGDQPLVPGAVVENKALADSCAAVFGETGDNRWSKMQDTYWNRYAKELEDQITADERKWGIKDQVTDDNGLRQTGMDIFYNHDFGD